MTDRDAAIYLLRKGLITQAEAGRLAGVSRQIIQHWVRMQHLDGLLIRAREAHLRRLWKETLHGRT
jgi:hypothetical protein